jgi:hypothetical protein
LVVVVWSGVATGEKVVRADDRKPHEILCATGDLVCSTLAVDSEHTVVAGYIEHSVGGVHPEAVDVLERRLAGLAASPATGEKCDGQRQH